MLLCFRLFFLFHETATTEIYTYGHTRSLHDPLPIYRWVLFVPLAIMGLLFGACIYRLVTPAETLIQSQWIYKPMPLFDLPPATAGVEGLKSSQLADGRPRLVNVFASWCLP